MKNKESCSIVTGASGVIGTALVDELKKSTDMPVISLTSTDVDLTDFNATKEIFAKYRPSIVYHLAARVSGIMGNMKGQGQGYYVNALINTNVIEAARICGAQKIVAMGSTAVYSDNVSLPMREEDIWMGPPHASEAGYAHAKRGMLAQLEAYRDQYGLDFAYCISTNLFGPNDRFDEKFGHVLPSLISKIYRATQENVPVGVWGSGEPRRDFLYSKDAALAMRLIAERFSGPINLATGNSISIRDTVAVIKKIALCKTKTEWDTSKPDGQRFRAYDVSKLSNIGFKPVYSFEDAIAETYMWYASHVQTVRR